MALRIQTWVIAAGLVAFSGCVAPGGGDTPTTTTAERKPPAKFERILPDESNLDKLREQERQQIARMDSLKQSIETDANQLRKEEAALRNIRNRMTEAQTAEQRSRQVLASREQVLYDGNAPLDAMERDLYREPPAAQQYSQQQQMPAMRQPTQRPDTSPAHMSSNAGVATLQTQPEPRMGLLPPQNAPVRQQPQQYAQPVQTQRQQQPAPRPASQQLQMPQQQIMMANDDIVWDPPANLFTAQPQQQQQYQQQRVRQQAQPVAARQHEQTRTQPPAQPIQPVAVQQPALPRVSDEVFTPDLFLSAGVNQG